VLRGWVELDLWAAMACADAAARCELAQQARHNRPEGRGTTTERTCLKNFESLLAGTPSRALDLDLLTGKLEKGNPCELG